MIPPVRGDNPRAIASGFSPGQVYNDGITILCKMNVFLWVTPSISGLKFHLLS